MRSPLGVEPLVTGLGVTTAVGRGREAFFSALMRGDHAFGIMARPGRQKGGETAYLGAELQEMQPPQAIPQKLWRTASLSGRAALVTLLEAWEEAHLDEVDPRRIGLVIGGSNLQQRELTEVQAAYADRLHFLRPTYGLTFLDSDLCGLCTQQFGMRGFAHTVGGASASGQLAVIEAAEAVRSGRVEVCIAMGALLDLSYWECAGLRALGAMGSNRFAREPARACRPFDRERDGFIFGEACGVVVVESAASASRRGVSPYGMLTGWAVAMDANRNPDPGLEGEIFVIGEALKAAQLRPQQVDYVNPHGSGSAIGDEIELEAIRRCGLGEASLNATKSITGHGLTAAGAVEVVATLLQMRHGRLHPSRNLEDPIDPGLCWVTERTGERRVEHALTLSLGFGGINTACLIRAFSERDA